MLRFQSRLWTFLSDVDDVQWLADNGGQGHRHPEDRSASAFLASVNLDHLRGGLPFLRGLKGSETINKCAKY